MYDLLEMRMEQAEQVDDGPELHEPLVTFATRVETEDMIYELRPRVSVVLLRSRSVLM